MARAIALTALAALLTLAGCITPSLDPVDASGALTGTLFAQSTPLWSDPQNAPHPAFGWPTLTHPAAGEGVPALWAPIPDAGLPDPIAGLEHLGKTEGVGRGAGIAVFGSLVVVPGFGQPSKVVDIRDPTAPKVLGELQGEHSHRGAAFIPYPDGRLVVVISTPVTIEVWDITTPTAPKALPSIEPKTGSHKVGVVPGTPIVYNANSDGGGRAGRVSATANGQIEIYDLTTPEAPVLVQELKNGYGCHHIYFWIDAGQEKYRALCAGIEVTQIFDIADPRAPELVVTVPVHHGSPALPSTGVVPVTFSHYAVLNDDGTVLVVGDEMGGGGAAACGAHAEVAGKSLSTPTGALWFYDVSDEKSPKLLGWFSPRAHLLDNPMVAGCTAHHGRLVPDASGRDLLVMAFYGAGVVLLDFTDPANAMIVDQWADRTNTWEAWYYNGYVFTGDLARGMDVLKFK